MTIVQTPKRDLVQVMTIQKSAEAILGHQHVDRMWLVREDAVLEDTGAEKPTSKCYAQCAQTGAVYCKFEVRVDWDPFVSVPIVVREEVEVPEDELAHLARPVLG